MTTEETTTFFAKMLEFLSIGSIPSWQWQCTTYGNGMRVFSSYKRMDEKMLMHIFVDEYGFPDSYIKYYNDIIGIDIHPFDRTLSGFIICAAIKPSFYPRISEESFKVCYSKMQEGIHEFLYDINQCIIE